MANEARSYTTFVVRSGPSEKEDLRETSASRWATRVRGGGGALQVPVTVSFIGVCILRARGASSIGLTVERCREVHASR